MSDEPRTPGAAAPLSLSMLDAGTLPLQELAELARREAHRPRPVYAAHKWFARRYGTAMRALLVASQVEDGADFWSAFLSSDLLAGKHVVDLFIGGGTSLYEASRLGANVTGVDIDPVATAVTEFELRARDLPDPFDVFTDVYDAAEPLRELYRTVGPDGDTRDGLHFFYVQQLTCGHCATTFDAHPSYRVALAGSEQWVVCSREACGQVRSISADAEQFTCDCGSVTVIGDAPLVRGKATCPECGHVEALITYARRTGQRPSFRMFAIESIPVTTNTRPASMTARIFHRPSPADLAALTSAEALQRPLAHLIPSRAIPNENRSDPRLLGYGYTAYSQLLNPRQLLHASWLLGAIASLPEPHRLSYALALSNHLTSNCVLTRYTERWRQVTPLFSLRAFAHSARPVELNPWLRGTGRGTFPNALRRVANAINFAKEPKELTVGNGFQTVPLPAEGTITVLQGDSRHQPDIADASADIVLTDPPYLDNIDYSELSDFFVPWLASAGVLIDPGGPSERSLAAKGRGQADADTFMDGLAACFREAARILKADGRLVFTFQHQSSSAWNALADALISTGLHVVSVFPLRGDSEMSLHRHPGSITWDAVFVLAKEPHPFPRTEDSAAEAADLLADAIQLAEPDRANLRRAYVAAAHVVAVAHDQLAPIRGS
ncbi:SAM-dependent methyltransferase [Leifsonia aquatica]|uniref:DNA methylase N-4/N-6 domain-containing protein n=2 Tax=Leifsonia aquatica TaxID=144185 RepID=U2T7V3_LEIAQ|nr:SAM-dependent methyltransferase [Leifsonia aquatica]ERK73553.1 hypothetical protein N136_00111 [Leifsonia aquatica ATCC 14665]MBB2968001.1 adenine-specific DNA methylase [Leifsonia aquatica]